MPARRVAAATRNTVWLLVVLLASRAALAETVRCGTDDFGNAVCMDRDGAVIAAPPDRQAGSAVPAAGSAGLSGNRQDDRARCGIDPFGNKVCR